MPTTAERLAAAMVHAQEVKTTVAPPTPANLFAPADHEWGVSGGWKRNGRSPGRTVVVVGTALASVPLGRVVLRRPRRR